MSEESFQQTFKQLWNQNPALGDLNLEGLSTEERERILDVVRKEQDFVYKEGRITKKGQIMEGQLSKFTNLMKGWQYRWFVLDAEGGTLSYYLDKEKTRIRGNVSLAGAVISPSEEDSMSFMVNASIGDIYKLRANDAKDRQHWINLIRAVAEYHRVADDPKVDAVISNSTKENQQTGSLKRAATISTTSPARRLRSPLLQKTKSVNHRQHQNVEQVQSPLVPRAVTNPIEDELKNIKDALNSVAEFHSSANEAFETAPQNGEVLSSLDEHVLLLKATSQATVNLLQQCHSILQQQSIDVQGTAHASGLPTGATIEWLEPNNRFERSMSLESGSSIDSATDAVAVDQDFLCMNEYEQDEIADQLIKADEKQEDMEPHKSVILHLLSQLKLGMDLTRVVLPTFVLEKRSLLEMYSDFLGHADLFVRIAEGENAEERMIRVLEFYLTSFHVGRKTSIAKKPYNPILGERFHCSFSTNDNTDINNPLSEVKTSGESSSDVHFVAEQVSHHPPISAFYAECPSKNISMNTHIWTKSKFYGMSIGVINIGEGVISLPDHNEEYIITFPNAYCRSILTVPWVELGGRTFIRCPKTGYNASVTFHTKPFYGGTPNRITCEIKACGADTDPIVGGRVICQGEGAWDGKIDLNFVDSRIDKIILDIPSLRITEKRVRPINIQNENESRKLWRHVTDPLKEGNLEKATEEKHKLEERQRNEAKQREAAGVEWKTKLFQKHGDTWSVNPHLAKVIKKRKSKSVSSN